MRKFSVVIPIYNAEKYIVEGIESVVKQSIGFEDNIQLILVNDGSTDSSEEICLRYREKYPNNIEYIYQENQGVASARNNGLDFVCGKYVTMLDADDKWTLDAFEKAYNYFEQHYSEIDVVACRVVIFGRKSGYHFLDYKFTGDRIVDITKDYAVPQMFCNSVFIKSEAVKDVRFNIKSAISEDIPFINELIFKTGKYALLKSIEYLYRKDETQGSAIDKRYEKYDFYITAPRDCYTYLMELSKNTYGEIIPYVQYLIANDARFKVTEKATHPKCLDENGWNDFIRIMHDVFDLIDEKYICALKKVELSEKAICLNFKCGAEFNHKYLLESLCINIEILNVRNGKLHIEGRSNIELLGEGYTVCIEDKKCNTIEIENHIAHAFDLKSMDGSVVITGKTFSVDIPVNENNEYHFVIKSRENGLKYSPLLKMGYYSRISKLKDSFFIECGKIIYRNNNKIVVEDKTWWKEQVKRVMFNRMLLKKGRRDIIIIRKKAESLKRGKPIWLLADRSDRAGDNAEAFLKYLKEVGADENYQIYFAISKNSTDYERLHEYGNVVDYGSDEHKAVFLAADKFISSQWTRVSPTNPTLNPFRKDRAYVQDMIDSDFIFLQHGIILNDMSKYGHKLKRNVKKFITSTEGEYNSILYGNYGYTEDEVVLTGLPRYDSLSSEGKERVILFMPTWRKSIGNISVEEFKKTEYYMFYSRLIGDEIIHENMKKYGYTGKLILHPVMHVAGYEEAFHSNDVIEVCKDEVSYSELFSKSSLYITDYSSTAMDFAYLRKPIIYIQFDEENFFNNHTLERGYFDYRNDGFGPVCENYEEAVEKIIEYIQTDCKVKKKYSDRINKFFKYNDTNNCERVYREI